MAWLLSFVPREVISRQQLIGRYETTFPNIEWSNAPELPFASAEVQRALRRRGNPIGGRFRVGRLTIDFQFVGTPESVPSVDLTVRGEGDPLPVLRDWLQAMGGRLHDQDTGGEINVHGHRCDAWESLFHNLRLRIGGNYAALRPSLKQLDELLEDILQGRQPYGGVVIEDAAERRELPWLHVARVLVPRGLPPANCWCLELSDAGESWIMCHEPKAGDKLVKSMLYGDPTSIQSRCLLSRADALQGIAYFLDHRSRHPNFPWLELSVAIPEMDETAT